MWMFTCVYCHVFLAPKPLGILCASLSDGDAGGPLSILAVTLRGHLLCPWPWVQYKCLSQHSNRRLFSPSSGVSLGPLPITGTHTLSNSGVSEWNKMNLVRQLTPVLGCPCLCLLPAAEVIISSLYFYHLTLSVKMLFEKCLPAALKSLCSPAKVFVQRGLQSCLFPWLPGTEERWVPPGEWEGGCIFGQEPRAFIWSFRVCHAAEHWLNGALGLSGSSCDIFLSLEAAGSHHPTDLAAAASGDPPQSRGGAASVGGRRGSLSSSSWSI